MQRFLTGSAAVLPLEWPRPDTSCSLASLGARLRLLLVGGAPVKAYPIRPGLGARFLGRERHPVFLEARALALGRCPQTRPAVEAINLLPPDSS